MSSIGTGRAAARLALGLASGGLLLLSVASGHAQESNFLEMLFGGGARPAPAQVRPSYERPRMSASRAPEYRRARVERHRERVARKSQKPSTRYVALPRPDENKITGRQIVDQKAILDDPKGVLLKDHTLRAGDIVVMPSGPKVFIGAAGKTHRISEFEDVKHSRFLDKKTRAQLVAMMVPIGAMTPEQARKVMTVRLKLAPPEEVPAVEAANAGQTTEADPSEAKAAEAKAEPAGPRVIAPWTTGQP